MNRISKIIAGTAGAGLAGYAAYLTTTFLRFGHPRRGTDPLLDRFMPAYDVREEHALDLDAPPDAVLAAAKEMDFDDSRIVRAIFKGRELLLRSKAQSTPLPRGLVAKTRALGWGVLDELKDREIVMGAVTKPWEANPVFRALPPEEFAAFADPDFVKIAWTLRAEPTADGGTVFRTETRAVATDAAARKKFRLYW